MPTKRNKVDRSRHVVDEYHLAEALTLQSALIPTFGFYAPWASGSERCGEKRDVDAIAACWHEREHELLALWIAGWRPTEKWVGVYKPGRPFTRPAGWWRYIAKERRRPRESERDYLIRHELLLPSECAPPHQRQNGPQ